MSSISGTSGVSLAQFLQSISGNTSNSTANASTGSITTTTSASSQIGHHHKHSGGFDKLASAIQSALQSAANGSSGTTTTTDANQTITQALEKIFKNGGLSGLLANDSDGDGDASAQVQNNPASNNPTSNNANPVAAGTTATNGLPDALVKTLQSFGVTAQQFQTDFASALKQAQESGSVDISSAFKSFPVGSVVDSVG